MPITSFIWGRPYCSLTHLPTPIFLQMGPPGKKVYSIQEITHTWWQRRAFGWKILLLFFFYPNAHNKSHTGRICFFFTSSSLCIFILPPLPPATNKSLMRCISTYMSVYVIYYDTLTSLLQARRQVPNVKSSPVSFLFPFLSISLPTFD